MQVEHPEIGWRYRVINGAAGGKEGVVVKVERTGFGVYYITIDDGSENQKVRLTDCERIKQ